MSPPSFRDAPCELTGYGPVTAATARDLIAGDVTWRRLLTSPVSGVVRDVGDLVYRPPAALARMVRTRHRTCRAIGCRQPIGDLDHTKPFPAGPTAESNLAGLCRGHHRIKTHSTWTVQQASAGALIWRSPAGQLPDLPRPRRSRPTPGVARQVAPSRSGPVSDR